jgi:putative heme iron utilization protein
MQQPLFELMAFSFITHLNISYSDPGFPGGSVVGFAPDEEGRPLFIFSGMSTHTQASPIYLHQCKNK